MPSFESTVVRDGDLVRKGLQGSVLLGKYPTAADITTLSATDGITLPAGYDSIGWISEDGLTFGTDVEVSEVRGWGASSMLRRDVQSTDRTIAFSALETKRLTSELRSGLDLSATTMSPQGEVVITHPDRMPTKYWRVLALGVDGEGDQRYYVAKFFPKATVSEFDEESWSDGDDPISYSVTMTALIDDTVGTACREFIFGPGALAAAGAMGWTASTLTAPTGLAAGAITATTVPLTWSTVASAASYVVRVSTNNGDTYTDVPSASGGTPTGASTTVTGRTAATAYRFRVLAVDSTGKRGPESASISATTLAA